ncbi:hypothetical protein ABPG74_002416 [Tetrahymena malaccensis]
MSQSQNEQRESIDSQQKNEEQSVKQSIPLNKSYENIENHKGHTNNHQNGENIKNNNQNNQQEELNKFQSKQQQQEEHQLKKLDNENPDAQDHNFSGQEQLKEKKQQDAQNVSNVKKSQDEHQDLNQKEIQPMNINNGQKQTQNQQDQNNTPKNEQQNTKQHTQVQSNEKKQQNESDNKHQNIETIQLQQIKDRLNNLNAGINKLKEENGITEDERFLQNLNNKYDQWIGLEQLNLENVNKIQQFDVKQRAYQLLVSYHKELKILKQQKQSDVDEIKRLKQIINENEKQNQLLKNKIDDLEFQLKSQMNIINQQQKNNKIEQAYNAYNPQQNLDIKSLNYVKQTNSSYSYLNNINNNDDLSQSNSFIKCLNSSEQGITEAYLTNREKNADANQSDTQTSFNLSPSVKKPITIKKLQDSFYSNKKRLSIRKEIDNTLKNISFNGEPQQNQQKEYEQQKNNQNQQHTIQLQTKKYRNLMNIQDEKSNLFQRHESNYQQDSANKHVKVRTNSHKDNIFYDGSPQKNKNHKVSQIEKANDKIKSIIREQKSFSVNQSNSLWINSIDLGDLQDQKGQQDSYQINKSKDKIKNILNSIEIPDQHQNDLIQNNYDQEPIKLIHNPKYQSKEIRQGDQKPKYQQSINSRVRKSNSIHQSSNLRLDPISQRQQASKKINESYQKFQ